jgi:hypothetical protein
LWTNLSLQISRGGWGLCLPFFILKSSYFISFIHHWGMFLPLFLVWSV